MGAFEKMGSAPLSGGYNINISRRGDGKYSMAKSVVTGEGADRTEMFFRGAFMQTGQELIAIRDFITNMFNDDGSEKVHEKKSKKS